MEIRDFAANRSFSENGLWQWYEKQGLARHASENSINGIPLQFRDTNLRTQRTAHSRPTIGLLGIGT
jgi:hypothetical protein